MHRSLEKIVDFKPFVLICVWLAVAVLSGSVKADQPQAEFYEIRIFRIYDFEKQAIADRYLRDALLPALNRQAIKNIGVFHNLKDPNDHSVFMVIPFASLEKFSQHDEKLATDSAYQSAASEFMQRNKGDGVYDRIESRLLKSFKSMPKMEFSQYSTNKAERFFELRFYESLTEEKGRRKVEMFDNGETQLMREAGLAPVFFGKVMAGPDMPGLAYLLSAANEKSHGEHWKTFLQSESWKQMKKMPQYQETVSNIKSIFLSPTSFSQF